MHSLILSILKQLIRVEWRIGFITNPLEDVLAGKPLTYQWVKSPYKNRWFADPFLLDVTDNHYIVLAEDYELGNDYACISKLTISRDTYQIVEARKILDDGSHMSFPVIIRKEGEIFVHPENSASGKLKLYRYDRENERLVFESVMVDEPLTDAVTINNDTSSVLFATHRDANPNGNTLYLYVGGCGKYHQTGKVMFDSNIARMAGNFFSYKGKTYRPAQDCSERYGGALIIQEMEKAGDSYTFKDIRKLASPHPKLKLGLHTFNIYKNAIIIDIYGYSGNHFISAGINKIRYALLGK